jgi:hypothetical protein
VLTGEALENVADALNKALADKRGFYPEEVVRSKGLFESRDDYRQRLAREVPVQLLTAINRRKPVDLSDEVKYPGQKSGQGSPIRKRRFLKN